MAAGNGSGFEAGTAAQPITASWAGAESVVFGGGSGVISTAQAAHGTKSALLTGTSTVSAGVYWQETIDATDTLVIRAYFYITALPNKDVSIIWVGDGSSQRANVDLTSTGAIRVRDDANAAKWNGVVTTSTGTLPTNQWVRVELSLSRHASTGTFHLTAYSGDGTTPLSGLDSGVMTGQNTGSSSYTMVRVGAKTSSSDATVTMHVDDWDYDRTTTTFIGPYVEYLPAPSSLTVTEVVSPTTLGGANGQVEIAWGSSAGAATYEMAIVEGEVTSGFTASTTDSASPHRFTGLEAGVYTVAVRAV